MYSIAKTYYTNFNVPLRHVLAVVHCSGTIDGTTQVKVHHPKFKNGEAVVRNVKAAQMFGKKVLAVLQIAY